MTKSAEIKNILKNVFVDKHVKALLKHYEDAILNFQEEEWETALTKVGKFVEAVLKAIMLHAGLTLPSSREFKVKRIIDQVAQITTLDDGIRLQIPRACTFIYDIACNRGARHDPDQIDSNLMDASVVVPVASWILCELVRHSEKGQSTPDEAANLVQLLMEKKYPLLENIDGRLYLNVEGLSAREVAMVLLNAAYPERMERGMLIDQIHRHGFSKANATMALSSLRNFIDDNGGHFKMRGLGRSKANEIFSKIQSARN